VSGVSGVFTVNLGNGTVLVGKAPEVKVIDGPFVILLPVWVSAYML
jgi:hypothetical protein